MIKSITSLIVFFPSLPLSFFSLAKAKYYAYIAISVFKKRGAIRVHKKYTNSTPTKIIIIIIKGKPKC